MQLGIIETVCAGKQNSGTAFGFPFFDIYLQIIDQDVLFGLSKISFLGTVNDVDFCLKLREKGYLNVFTPFAELFHYESLSRGLDLEGKNAQRYEKESEHFRTKWKEVLDKGDPYYNPNFSLDRSDFSLNVEGYSSLRTQ